MKQEDRKFSLCVCTPTHRGTFTSQYVISLVALQASLLKLDIKFEILLTENISIISHARNNLANRFLNDTSCSHMLFIDDDMGFAVDDLMKMFDWRDDADVIAAMYPKKAFDWRRVKELVLANPEIDPTHLPHLAANFEGMWAFTDPDAPLTVSERAIPVGAIGTGLMMVSRQCLLRLQGSGKVPFIKHIPTVSEGSFWEFFQSQGNVGEDFGFCNLVRSVGGTILGCPWVTVTHTGPHTWVGDLKAIARYAPDT